MPPYEICPCTVSDGEALARNNMSAFWEDPTWILSWMTKTREYMIEQSAKRQPRNLLRDRDTLRHQRAVDTETGHVVGYARWKLPLGRIATAGGEAEWAEAQVPDVSAEERSLFEQLASTADWKGTGGSGALDIPVTAKKTEILAKKPYLCTFSFDTPLDSTVGAITRPYSLTLDCS